MSGGRNRGQDDNQVASSDPLLPKAVRVGIGVIFAVPLLVCVALFAVPEKALGLWPWSLSPLTARVVAAMFSLPGVVGLGIAMDPRWSSAKIILQAQAFSIALILIAAARAWADFSQPGLAAWLFVGGLGSMLMGILVLHAIMDSRGFLLKTSGA